MPIINFASCASSGNLPNGGCTFLPGIVKGAILVPKGTVLTVTQMATIKTSLQGLLITDARPARSFMVGQLGKFKDNSQAPKTEDVDGYDRTTYMGNYDFMYQLITGGKCQHQSLRGFNLMQDLYDAYFFDDKTNLWGWNSPDSSGNPQLAAFSLFELRVDNFKTATVSTIPVFPIRFALEEALQMNEQFAYVTCGFSPLASLKGPFDAVLKATGSAGSYVVSGTFNCGASDLGATYGSALAHVTAWIVNDKTTNTTLTVSAAAYNAVNNTYTLTVTGGTTADVLQITFAAISVMSASPISISYITNESANAASATW